VTYAFKISRRIAMNHRALAIPALFSLALLTACGGSDPTQSTTPPITATATAGWLAIELDSPNTNDGAVQIAVTGPAMSEARVEAPFDGLGTLSGTSAIVVVTGPLQDGVVARIRVPDIAKSAQYSATVQAAAVKGSYALQTLTGYRATVIR
jgi:hypothetical protein